jgi:O-antigen ligase
MLELIYVLYLLSGYMKGMLKAFSIPVPVDITLLFAIILLMFSFFIKIKIENKKVMKIILLLILFIGWMLFSSLYTSSNNYWEHKVIYFLTNIIAFFIPLIFYKKFNINNFIFYFISISTFLNVIFITMVLPYIYINENFYEVSGIYLNVSLISGLNILFFIIKKFEFKIKYLSLFILILNFITLISSGGRGGILFTFLILFIFLISKQTKLIRKGKISKKVFKLFLIFILIIFSISVYYANNSEKKDDLVVKSINRLTLLENVVNNSEDSGASINTRLNYINFTTNKILMNPTHFFFGYGIGSFGMEYLNIDKREYPHNVLLEIWFEMGAVGLILFIWFIFYIIKNFRQSMMIWFLFYMLLHILKSSSLTDIRIFFAILALLIIDSFSKKIIYQEVNI